MSPKTLITIGIAIHARLYYLSHIKFTTVYEDRRSVAYIIIDPHSQFPMKVRKPSVVIASFSLVLYPHLDVSLFQAQVINLP